MIRSLLIANRGEIARRIMRTARAMGIRTIAVHSDVDANMPFVREAGTAICIGPAPARESYLDQAKILAAARETGAEAIHPGYGFLSENAEFAEAVIAAGLVWVGAPPAAIRAMGLKDAAKARMVAAGVPVTPGYLGEDQSPERLRAEADAIGYPVLIKAVAGGGGKGMRRVEEASAFLDALESCRREAASSFGDDRVLIEKYILNPRHIEVQVFGDTHGNVVHLFERDCSLQRRHQKVIEEAPAPGMDEATREAICATAVRAARAVDYVGAGTIEFIADASDGLRADRIWFMEMNTRLQVEHPVTEAITGQDLVEWQLRVASGEPLPRRQDELAIDGWAMEARLYAENPATGFLPSTGKLDWLRLPMPDVGADPNGPGTVYITDDPARDRGIRVDAGVAQGNEISTFYDPMIAKIIAHGPSRAAALERLAEAVGETSSYPVKTNAGFLTRTLMLPDFAGKRIDTGFIERHLDETVVRPRIPAPACALAAVMLAGSEHRAAGWTIYAPATFLRRGEKPWAANRGFRLNAPSSDTAWIEVDGETVECDLEQASASTSMVVSREDGIFVGEGGETYFITLPTADHSSGGASASDGAILAPMPGRIVSVEVAEGDAVTAGQKLVVLEAMKMEQALVAPFDGVVEELRAAPGGQVSEGALLARIIKAES